MATVTGANLLASIIESTGVEVNSIIQNSLTMRLQTLLDNGFTSTMVLGTAMRAFSTAIEGAVTMNELMVDITTNIALIEVADEPVITLSVDIGTLEVPESLSASGSSYIFTDDADILNCVIISGFTTNDSIHVSNASDGEYSFSNDGEDVDIIYNNGGTVNMITLTGVVSVDDLVYDESSFETAIGFDAFQFV